VLCHVESIMLIRVRRNLVCWISNFLKPKIERGVLGDVLLHYERSYLIVINELCILVYFNYFILFISISTHKKCVWIICMVVWQFLFGAFTQAFILINTFTASGRFNNSCLRLPASTLVDLIFQSHSFSLGGKLVQQLQYI
jgi:hypothetical protein